jgi:hypothetical protein
MSGLQLLLPLLAVLVALAPVPTSTYSSDTPVDLACARIFHPWHLNSNT